MEKLLDWDDIMLQPSELNTGYYSNNDYYIINEDKTKSFPIFTSPMKPVVDGSNWQVWYNNGIRPILPRTEALNTRIEGCQYIFAAFSLSEIKSCFLDRKINSNQYIRVCIDCGNGEDIEIFNISIKLKNLYGEQIIIMAGNLGNAKSYVNYCKAGIDYVRVGANTGSLVDTDIYGFYTPLPAMLLDIKFAKTTTCNGLKLTKVIADGGIYCPVTIIKALALGADYVMCGRQFVKLVEAAGKLHNKTKNSTGATIYETVSNDEALKIPVNELGDLELFRLYYGNTSLESQAIRDGYEDVHDWLNTQGSKHKKFVDSKTEWIQVKNNLSSWISEFVSKSSYAFTLSNAHNWTEYKRNINFGRIS